MASRHPHLMIGILGSTLVLTAATLGVVGLEHHGARSAPRSGSGPGAVVVHSASARLTCRLRRPRFHTLPDLEPTGFCLAVRAGRRPTGQDILVTPRPDPKRHPGAQFGLMIISPDGKLLWYRRAPTKVHDLKMVRYRGRPMLAYFQQDGSHGYYQLLDDHYAPVQQIVAARGRSTNLHELQIEPDDTAWVSADSRVQRAGGGPVVQFVVQHLDPATGRLLFEWPSIRHVPPGDSYERRPRRGEWDYFHGNSIDASPSPGSVAIVSSRNTSSLYGVDPRSGRVRWILGGRRDQFG